MQRKRQHLQQHTTTNTGMTQAWTHSTPALQILASAAGFESPSKFIPAISQAVSDTGFLRNQSTSFYTNDFDESNGIPHLIATSFFKNSIHFKQIHKSDVTLCF